MSSAGTVNGRGFVISYSVQSNFYNGGSNIAFQCRGGYDVTIDNTSVASCTEVNNGDGTNVTSSDTHKFFTSNIGLPFTTGTSGGHDQHVTGSGSMKYILGS